METQQEKAVTSPVAAAVNGSGAELIGYVDVHVQSARDIQNICIYHKQDVYARLSLPGEGAPAASTQVINGGGRNPVFDQSLRLGVRAGDVDGALRCEVWMLSRVQNYMQDQLLGFALVPLPDVVAAEGGTLARDFPLSTNDMFHSHAGFLQLELSYIGVVPEVVPISPTPKPALADTDEPEVVAAGDANGREYEKIEFPDLNLVEENQLMLSEYIGLPCTGVEPQSTESLLTSEDGDGATTETHDAGVRVVESFSTDNSTADSTFQSDTPVSSVSTIEFPPAAAVPATPQSNSEPSSGNAVSSAEHKEKSSDAEVNSSRTTVQNSPAAYSPSAMSESAVDKPVMSVNFEQEIKDMYMKSMQQFTESLAKMKLPLDMDTCSDNNNSGASDADSGAVKKPAAGGPQEKSPKVFYGSRAFF
ncbi:hypothetical protein GUJ93_ZPchr0007g4706 [Zizania palustris]|uniref:C2 domain-containing protein n=1 Tax=Zizania palustris TaxID=103762 RepID=A0A8J5W4Z8_ZIZPA|nr:hypothetical protein GUJ93_ZPchr0007g4706 [Zizania palustris]KAG8079954.1 hypothetical protein GUJ93_ZPchr0007g4706 [Zizania palustris]KAG8079955.1 hypothetical protein GUJ93_ZPchr0007g4706 [Zizania palustris]